MARPYPSYPYLGLLVKLTSKNQLTLPEEVLAGFEGVKYFDVTKDKGEIVLTPVMTPADKIRVELLERGITEADMAKAVAWARRNTAD